MSANKRDFTGSNNPRWNGGCSLYPEHMNYINMIRRGRMKTGYSADIKVCKRWRDSFWNFYDDMGPKPTNGRYTIDRINPYGDYTPENCRWATAAEQIRNRKTGIKFSETAKNNIRQAAIGNTNRRGKFKGGEPSRTTLWRYKKMGLSLS